MKVDSEFSINGRPRFQRLYICYGACKEGFLAGCRPLVGLDGCHLKGVQKGGQLLTAVGVDANNSMFPIAFAIVESEGKETWSWFLEMLNTDLGLQNNPGAWTIISDKQKGLLPAVEELLPDIEHRFCVRHMHANFVKDGFGGQQLKQQLWKIAKATTEAQFNLKMQELREMNSVAADWVADRDPVHYSRAFFSEFPKSDMLVNNLCESWNISILNFRDKSILSMCENLRIYLMIRMQQNREKMQLHPLRICPKIMKELEESKDKANDYIAYKANEDLYQVEDCYLRQFKVDLRQHTCSCRRWNLIGIPCSHIVASLWKKRVNPIDYVHQCYNVETYLRAYSPAIMPIHSSEQWKKTGIPPHLPPKYKAQPGRPKSKRKLGPAEIEKPPIDNKKRKKGEAKRCTMYGEKGHNKRVGNENDGNEQLVGNDGLDGAFVFEADAFHVTTETQQLSDDGLVFEADAFHVQVETQVHSFVLKEMDTMFSQPANSSQSGSQGIQSSNFISAFTSTTGTSQGQLDNVISRGGRHYVTLSSLQQGRATHQSKKKDVAKKLQVKKKK